MTLKLNTHTIQTEKLSPPFIALIGVVQKNNPRYITTTMRESERMITTTTTSTTPYMVYLTHTMRIITMKVMMLPMMKDFPH